MRGPCDAQRRYRTFPALRLAVAPGQTVPCHANLPHRFCRSASRSISRRVSSGRRGHAAIKRVRSASSAAGGTSAGLAAGAVCAPDGAPLSGRIAVFQLGFEGCSSPVPPNRGPTDRVDVCCPFRIVSVKCDGIASRLPVPDPHGTAIVPETRSLRASADISKPRGGGELATWNAYSLSRLAAASARRLVYPCGRAVRSRRADVCPRLQWRLFLCKRSPRPCILTNWGTSARNQARAANRGAMPS